MAQALVPRLSSAPTTPRSPATLLPTPGAPDTYSKSSPPRTQWRLPRSFSQELPDQEHHKQKRAPLFLIAEGVRIQLVNLLEGALGETGANMF